MKFQFWFRPVQCSSSAAGIGSSGYRWNQRCPPSPAGRVSQHSGSDCSRPPGNSTKYCCSGVTPKVYTTRYSPTEPSGPSVSTKYPPSRVKNRLVTPKCSSVAPPKSPSTVSAVASCIARSWCEPSQRSCSAPWHSAHAARPTNRAGAVGAVPPGAGWPSGEQAPSHPQASKPISTGRAVGIRRV